jgi:GH24 family phage-related lysozyme (muramidase)
MRTSASGRKLIESFEGLELKAYRDCVGVWTIGYGHTAKAGKPVPVAGLTITQAMADMILSDDLHAFETGVLAAIKRPMEQGQFDAMVSLAFNIGLGAFRSSSVARYFNRGQPLLAADAFLLWARAGGIVQLGLMRRREAERHAFLFASPPDLPSVHETAMAHAVDNPHGPVQRMAARAELELAGLWA